MWLVFLGSGKMNLGTTKTPRSFLQPASLQVCKLFFFFRFCLAPCHPTGLMVHWEIPTIPDGHFAHASRIKMMNVSQYFVAYHVLFSGLQNVLKLIYAIMKFIAATNHCFHY